ncbi:hypothetical protein HFP89_00750 [Wenzhouxiangella sp. XN79A]|uniref:WD40/YVTN/BNR-like repeat-containing protein n=1 Tax=Wenzhouxiangella sp. XN79A TaxID=2724193 RepID=UPI00144AA171|nr:sialidase family protein [Wenzhouxiangella sp. XN79A]NKI33692.1 hypothetical protein [Wenzhouxiangella sp. XN79A]
MKSRLLFCLPLALILLAWSDPSSAGPGVWTSSGPAGGRADVLVASPFTADEFYALGNGTVFKSIDGGTTWSEASAGINRRVFQLVHGGTAANRLLASNSSKIWYSNDGAMTWQDRSPPAALLGTESIGRIAASSALPGTYYAAASDGRVLITEDSGLTWRASAPIVQPDDLFIQAIAADPAVPHRVLVATATDFGVSDHRIWVGDLSDPPPPTVWTTVPCAVDCPWDQAPIAEFEFGSMGRVWAIPSFGGPVTRSDDGGLTWTATSVVSGNRISVNPVDNTEAYVAGDEGLHYTTDDGATWTQVLSGFVGNDLLQPARSSDVIYNPFNPSIQLAGSFTNGVYRRNALPPLDTFVPQISGFTAQQIRAVASNTLDRVHAGVSDSFGATYVGFRSVNNGATWSTANAGLDADQFRALVVDPNDSDVIYAGGRFDPKSDNLGVTVPGNGGVFKSTNGGLNWVTIDNGIPLTPAPFAFSLFGTVRDIAIDPGSADPVSGESQVLYAVGSGRFRQDSAMPGTVVQDAARIYKSTDAGTTWVASETGIGGGEITATGQVIFASGVQIIVDPTDPSGNTLYFAAFISRPTATEPTIDNGVFKSIDGGATWSNVTNGLPRANGSTAPGAVSADVLSLAIDPTSGHLYASINDLTNSALGTVYTSTDGALNWSFAGTGLDNRDVRDLAVDPVTGDVYAAVVDPLGNGDGGVFVSDDGGASWASLSTGFPGTAVALKLELDNSGPELLIHAGTSRGVQSFTALPDGDTDGATDDTEDAAPAVARGGLPGDGNGDGTLDRLQQDVASPQVVTATRGTPVTITASITPISGTCDRLENSFGLGLLSGVPSEATYDSPFSGLHLRIPDCEEAEVQLVYHTRSFDDDPSWRIRGYGLAFPDQETTAWFDIEPASVSGSTWSFTVADGAIGDATPDDGIIVFQGAAKQLTEAFFADSMEAE